MKNIVICTSGSSIGGMEVMFSNYIRFLIKRRYKVYLITENILGNIYHKLLSDIEDQIIYIKRNPCNVMYLTTKEQEELRISVLSKFGKIDYNTIYCTCGYFIDLMMLLIIFKNKSVKISMIWPHPLNWVNQLFFIKNTYHLQRRPYLSFYRKQKDLLELMHNHNAFFYTSYSIFYFNRWYYSAKLDDRIIEGLPVQINSGLEFDYVSPIRDGLWNILWVGRFDFFKNDAICKIHRTLELIAYKKNVKICFNIVGHGKKEFEDALKRNLQSNNIKVSFLGTVKPDELNNVFRANDIGIAMGVTVKQMGYAGLPAILIDSMSKYYKKERCCNWIFDIETGDDGDGMYYDAAKMTLRNRESLYDVLSSVIDNPDLLIDYSNRCKEYVQKYYSYERQYEIITDRVLNSSFTSDQAMPIVYGWFRRFVRRTFRLITGKRQ